MTVDKKDVDELEELRTMLRGAIPPVPEEEPGRDLWPLMLQRLERDQGQWFSHVPWFDWALIGAAGAVLVFFPALIPALLYHL